MLTATRSLLAALSVLMFTSLTAAAAELSGEVVAAVDGQPLAARIYLQKLDNGTFHFVRSQSVTAAVPYDRTNWINKRSVEQHTCVPAAPFVTAGLAPGRYVLTVERGQEYFPEARELTLGDQPVHVRVPLRRWINMAERGWYSGETHIHRTLAELPVLLQAEDLNVALPLTYWVTKAFTPPTTGDKNMGGEIPEQLVKVDPTHVIWPRNTEYEIFTVGAASHTLGALFVLNHKSVLNQGVPPWGKIAEQARREGAILDMDKLDWPFAMTLPDSTGATLYELANNHLWRTEFAFRDWNSATPAFLQPPRGGKSGGERDWLHYTLGVYYTLLDAGFRLVPTAGTANGVHPVPAGFSRVYVSLPQGFSYEAWLAGLNAGRSFVTTGPMLLATVNGLPPGATIPAAGGPAKVKVAGTISSEHPLAFLEVVANGQVISTIMPSNKQTATGARETAFATEVALDSSGWLCVRGFADRPDGRVRFAHTAPWWIEIPNRPLRPRREEKEYLIRRVTDEIARSREKLPPEALAEYTAALTRFEKLEARPDDTTEARRPSDEANLRTWLENMVWHHRFAVDEMQAAIGLEKREIEQALAKFNISEQTRPPHSSAAPLLVLPYPGGRHPRIGFPDGALQPQRDTKVSVFAPWDDCSSYVVVDVPEAVWSNLGLTYLAHTHVPTLWDKQGVKLPRREWQRRDDGALEMERALPNKITFGARVAPADKQVRFDLWLRNGTAAPLTGLHAQVCVMLKGAAGLSAQTGTNKVVREHAVAVRSDNGRRWIVTAWEPSRRVWHNPPVPCLHSDPSFPDCPPGQTVRAHGLLTFYEGSDINAELQRVAAAVVNGDAARH